jgi:dephospho-CoA kinase
MRAGLRLVGLTGGIGSGKSTVARLIAELGVPVLDADRLAREVVAPGQPAHADIAAAWPEVIAPDGAIDRKRLGTIVFADPDARRRLEAITHPRIHALCDRRAVELAQQGHRLAFYEASLLVETGRHRDLDGLVVVTASEETQVRRTVARDGLTAGEARARIAAQLPQADKVRVATDVIDNDGSLEATRAEVTRLVRRLRQDAPAGT